MHRCRVGWHELAVEGWIGAADRPVAEGTSREIVRRYRSAQRVIPLRRELDGFTAVRTEFGPGCRELLRRASAEIPAFVCEPVAPREAEEVARTYLIDAAMSQAEGRGPLVVTR